MDNIFIYNLKNDQWHEFQIKLPGTRFELGCVLIRNELHVIGGRDKTNHWVIDVIHEVNMFIRFAVLFVRSS